MRISKTKLGIYSSLGSVKMRRKHSLFTVEGEKSVSDTLGGFELEALILVEGYETPLSESVENVVEVTEEEMKKLSNLSTPSKVMAVFLMPMQPESAPRELEPGLYMVLDSVRDPGNLGTIVRTCHWFGIKRIFASFDTVDIFNPKTVQATMGSLAHVSVEYCNPAELFSFNPGLPVYGMLLDGENIFKAPLEKRGFIVMGNEGNGISPELRSLVTSPLLIPPGGEDHSESLNVAIAAAITLAQFCGR